MILGLIVILLCTLLAYSWATRADEQQRLRSMCECLWQRLTKQDKAKRTHEAWKSHAIALEAFCEALGDGDETGCANASAEIQRTRQTLVSMGEYD